MKMNVILLSLTVILLAVGMFNSGVVDAFSIGEYDNTIEIKNGLIKLRFLFEYNDKLYKPSDINMPFTQFYEKSEGGYKFGYNLTVPSGVQPNSEASMIIILDTPLKVEVIDDYNFRISNRLINFDDVRDAGFTTSYGKKNGKYYFKMTKIVNPNENIFIDPFVYEAAYSIDANTLALYHFDTGSGTTAVDSTGTYDASFKGANDPIWSDVARFGGYSVYFDEVGDYVQQATLLDVFPENGTIEFWFRLNNTYTAGSGYMCLMNKYQDVPGNDGVNIYMSDADGKLTVAFYYDTTQYPVASSTTSWTADTWYHVALTWGVMGIQLYINETLQDSDSFTGKPQDGTSYNFELGYYTKSTTWPFNGSIDEVRISDIQRNMSEELPGDTPPVITVYSPISKIYDINESNVLLNFTLVDDNTTSLNCWRNLTGTLTDLGNITNNTFYNSTMELMAGLYTLNVICEDSFPQNGTSSQISFSIIPRVNITVFDEETIAPIFFNITISNTTDTTTWYNINGTFDNSTAPYGDVTIKISNTAYGDRYYYVSTNESRVFNGYLLKTAVGSTVVFITIETTPPYNTISDALLIFERQLNNTWKIISKKMTDDSGIASIFLKISEEHRITAIKSGYITAIKTLTPVSSPYQIRMSPTVSTNLSFGYIFDDITYSITPSILLDNSTWLDFTITSHTDSLESFGLTVYWNDTSLYSEISTNISGGNLTASPLNLTNATGMYVNLTAYFVKTGYEQYDINMLFYVLPHGLYNETGTIYGLRSTIEALPMIVRLIAALFIAIFIIASFGSHLGMGGSGIVILIFWGFLTNIGWFVGVPHWEALYILMILTLFSMYIIKSRW